MQTQMLGVGRKRRRSCEYESVCEWISARCATQGQMVSQMVCRRLS